MKERVSLATPLLLVVFASGVMAQAPVRIPADQGPPPPAAAAPPPGPCPKLELQTGANRILRDGESVAIVAALTGGDTQVAPTFVWSTSAGAIKAGQGTRNIEVDSSGAGSERQMTIDLWVGGYAAECTVQSSAVVRVAGPAFKADEFGDLPLEQETQRLNELAASQAESGDAILVIAYAGRANVRLYASNALKRIKAQLVAGGMPAQRVTTLDGGFRETAAFEIWVVPFGAQAPKATPTVDRKEIVYPKTAPTPTKRP